MKVLGIDVSLGSVKVCLLDGYPDGGIEERWKETRNSKLRNYPQFYSAPKNKKGQQKQKNAIQDSSRRIETKLIALLNDSCIEIYHQVFDKFGFGLRIRANILSRIYLFESFLTSDITELIEYEVADVCAKKRSRSKEGRTIVNKGLAEEKRA